MEHGRQLDIYQALRNRLAGWLIERHPVLRHTQVALLPPDVLHLIIRLLADDRVPPQLADIVLGLSAHRWLAAPIERPALPAVEACYARLGTRPGLLRDVA